MVSMVVFMIFMFSIIGGMTVSICGINWSIFSMSTTVACRSSVSASTLSRLSKADFIALHSGMS